MSGELPIFALYLALVGFFYWALLKVLRRLLDPSGELENVPPPPIVRWVAIFIALFLPGVLITVLHGLLSFFL